MAVGVSGTNTTPNTNITTTTTKLENNKIEVKGCLMYAVDFLKKKAHTKPVGAV